MCFLPGLMSEINHTSDDTVSILLSGEDNRWYMDHDESISSSYSYNDEIYRPHKGENEMALNFLTLAKYEY